MTRKQREILPDWPLPVAAVAVVLQRSRFPLNAKTPAIETEKARLRAEFLQFGDWMVAQLSDRGNLSDFFEPKTGEPVKSRPGAIACDCVAVTSALLGYATIPGPCARIEHPRWGTAVYPGIAVSVATPAAMKAAILD